MESDVIPGINDVIPGLTRDPRGGDSSAAWIAGQARNDITSPYPFMDCGSSPQ
jgi:hypothetical protein